MVHGPPSKPVGPRRLPQTGPQTVSPSTLSTSGPTGVNHSPAKRHSRTGCRRCRRAVGSVSPDLVADSFIFHKAALPGRCRMSDPVALGWPQRPTQECLSTVRQSLLDTHGNKHASANPHSKHFRTSRLCIFSVWLVWCPDCRPGLKQGC